MRFKQYDIVKLVHGFPEDGVEPGSRAVILEVYETPEPGYEVEVELPDEELYTAGVAEVDVEPAEG